MSLEGWLFGRKVIYLAKNKPYYEQIPDEAPYLFGERVCPMPFSFHFLLRAYAYSLFTLAMLFCFTFSLRSSSHSYLSHFPLATVV